MYVRQALSALSSFPYPLSMTAFYILRLVLELNCGLESL